MNTTTHPEEAMPELPVYMRTASGVDLCDHAAATAALAAEREQLALSDRVLKLANAGLEERDAELAVLRERVRGLEKDAALYQTLRGQLHPFKNGHTRLPDISVPFRPEQTYTAEGLDAAVDDVIDAMKKEKGNG